MHYIRAEPSCVLHRDVPYHHMHATYKQPPTSYLSHHMYYMETYHTVICITLELNRHMYYIETYHTIMCIPLINSHLRHICTIICTTQRRTIPSPYVQLVPQVRTTVASWNRSHITTVANWYRGHVATVANWYRGHVATVGSRHRTWGTPWLVGSIHQYGLVRINATFISSIIYGMQARLLWLTFNICLTGHIA